MLTSTFLGPAMNFLGFVTRKKHFWQNDQVLGCRSRTEHSLIHRWDKKFEGVTKVYSGQVEKWDYYYLRLRRWSLAFDLCHFKEFIKHPSEERISHSIWNSG